MGEAKRRKKLMGEDYGKKRQYVIRGIQDRQAHVEKLEKDWMTNLKGILKEQNRESIIEMPVEEFIQMQAKCQHWLQNYFVSYRPEDVQELVIGFFNPLYEELHNLQQNYQHIGKKESVQRMVDVSLSIMFSYSCLKNYLKDEAREICQIPVQNICLEFWQVTLNNPKSLKNTETAKITKEVIRYLMQNCLEPSENSQDSSQSTPKEITQKEQHETIFYQ